MKKLLFLALKMRKRKVSRYITIFLFVGLLFAAGNYLLSPKHNTPSTKNMAIKNGATSQNSGRGGGATSSASCIRLDDGNCWNSTPHRDPTGCVAGWVDVPTDVCIKPSDINTGGLELDVSSGDPRWLADRGRWLPGQGTIPAFFFQTLFDPIMADGSFTFSMWLTILGVADLYIVVLVLMNGFRILGGAIGFRYTEAIETLPRMVLIIIVAHVSLLFAAFWIALTNNLTQFIYINITHYAASYNLTPQYPVIDDPYFTFGGGQGNPITEYWRGDYNQFDIFSLFEQALPKFIVWGLLQVITVQALIRLIGLLLAILFGGPLVMMGASPLKQGKDAMRGWFMTIITTSLSQPVQVMFLLIGGVLAQSLYAHIALPTGLTTQQAAVNDKDANVATTALILWIEAAVLWGTIRSVSLVRSSIANMGADAAQNMGGQAGGMAWAASSARYAYDQGWNQFRTGL